MEGLVSELDHTLQPVQTEPIPASAPVNPPVKVTTSVDTVDRAPQVVDGRVRVSDDISQQAVDQGFQPDIQPKAAIAAVAVTTGVGDSLGAQQVTTVYPDTTAGQIQGLRDAGKDAEADAIVNTAAASAAAYDKLQAPMSAQVAAAAADLVDGGFVAPEDASGVVPTVGPVEQVPLDASGSPVSGSPAVSTPVAPASADSTQVDNPGTPAV